MRSGCAGLHILVRAAARLTPRVLFLQDLAKSGTWRVRVVTPDVYGATPLHYVGYGGVVAGAPTGAWRRRSRPGRCGMSQTPARGGFVAPGARRPH